jgi:uncharacterized protein (TIGR02996 family)
VYALELMRDCRYHLEDLGGGFQMDGVRVADLCRYVLTHPGEDDLSGGLWLLCCALKEMLAAPGGEDAGFLAAIRDNPGDGLHWGVYSDWLLERGQPPAGLYLLEAALRTDKFGETGKTRKPALDRVKVTPHMAQACKHEERGMDRSPLGRSARDSYTQWIYFDDRWAAANPTIASGLLRFAARWDVLSPEGGDGDEE